jgi:MFS transporter, YNFM family, putative membrane transport protein
VTAPKSGTLSGSPPATHSGIDHTAAQTYLHRGSRAYCRAALALLAAGYATFSLLYCVQPLLPAFTAEFGVSAAQSSLAISLSTGALAIAILAAGFASDACSRRGLMTASLLASAVLTVIAALVPEWHQLLAVRALEGLTLGGVPAVAMAYLAEEVHPNGLGLAMGLYVGGTAIGGLAGRVISGVVWEIASWRIAIGVIGLLGLAATAVFWRLLPPSRHFTPRRGAGFAMRRSLLFRQWRVPGLPALFAMAFVLMGSFVTLYNYLGYRLIAPPYSLSQSLIGAIFVVYLVGSIASPLSGRMADSLGRGPVLVTMVALMLAGVGLTALEPLAAVIIGIVLVTFGFFAAHSVASGWVGRLAKQSKGQAAALYLLAYYVGSSVVGSYGGYFWTRRGWPGVAGLVGALLILGLAVSATLAWRERALDETR